MNRPATHALVALPLVALVAASCGSDGSPLPSLGPDGGLDAAGPDASLVAVPDAALDTGPVDVAGPDAEPDTAGPDAAADLQADLAPMVTPFRAIAPCSAESDYLPGDTIKATAVLKYSPACLKVKRGASVKFDMNLEIHPLKRSTQRGDVARNPIQDTATDSRPTFTFNEAGFFAYYCNLHGSTDTGTGMAGVVWVTDEPPPPNGGVGALVPSSHDFGFQLVGTESDPFTFTVLNPGTAALAGLAVNVTGLDFVGEDHCSGTTLAPGASCLINVRFKPATRGLKTGTVIASAGGQTVNASLTGTGQSPARLAVTPVRGEFGLAGYGPVSVIFTVANAGDAPTGQISFSISGTDAMYFKIVTNGCLAGPLLGGGTCSVTVVLDAPTTGARAGTLTVSSPVGGVVAVPLTGLVQ